MSAVLSPVAKAVAASTTPAFTVCDAKGYFKPFRYPFAFEAYQMQNKMHWSPEEVPLHDDIRDWKQKLSAAERNLLTHLFRFFTQGDVDVGQAYMDTYMPVFRNEEIRMMLSAFANMESVHAHAYSLLLDTIGMPEAEYQAFKQFEVMAAKHDYLENFDITDEASVARALAVFSGFTEGLQLFSTFAILMNFQRFGKMKGMGQIVAWSIKDESLHVESMSKLFRVYVSERPHLWTAELQDEIGRICDEMVELEDAFIDLAFEQGGIQGLTAEEVKAYIRFIADRRLAGLGLSARYHVAKNPLDWLDHIMNGVEHANFFEARATEYAKGAMRGSWAEVWASVPADMVVGPAAEDAEEVMGTRLSMRPHRELRDGVAEAVER